jgi:long-chain acyl-CoA synthetase
MYRKLWEGIEKSGKAGILKILLGVSQFLRVFGIDLRRKLFHSVFEKLGPRLRYAISGAAPIDPAVIVGFDKIGLTLLQGYGLTETSPVISAVNEQEGAIGSTGNPMFGVEVTIDNPDENGMGEILTRGPSVMLGYYENEEASKEVLIEDGWFRTGDLGRLDKKGYLYITGRVKSMIVFTNGKKAFPEEYEMLLNNIPGVKASFAWGNKASDGDIQVCCELTLADDLEEDDASIVARFDAAIREINKDIPQYKIIRYYVVSRGSIEMTTTLKIKRPVEHAKIKAKLDAAGLDMRRASGMFLEKI